MKRSTQRSIYIQIMLFSMSGIYTMFKDKKKWNYFDTKQPMFANGNIYRNGNGIEGSERETIFDGIKFELIKK